ncbi:unnamed protein product [marine sediment metagenome]|uniref:Uncharacterized protein n=1 Tax=marine sediment metagenome TaxID=412755 RepID=X1KBF3_9ZZZZ
MIELTMCIGLFLGVCGHIEHATYDNYDDCYRAADFAIKSDKDKNLKWAICKKVPPKALGEDNDW